MTSRIVVVSPAHRTILQSTNHNSSEKENQRQRGVILHSRRGVRECSDSDSEEWTSSGKRKRTAPNYVTNADGAHPRRRVRHLQQNPSPALTPSPSVPSHVIARRNERERNRVRQVNDSFAVLRSRIPEYLYEAETEDQAKSNARKKLSKVETLRLAVDYIQQLEVLLDIKEESSRGSSQTNDERFQFFGSETQGSSLKTESETESDIMDLSSEHRSLENDGQSLSGIIAIDREDRYTASPPQCIGVNCKTEDVPGYVKEEMDELDERSSDGDGLSGDVDSSAAGSPLPPMSECFPTKSLSLNYSDLYAPYGLMDLSTKCD